MGWGELLLFDVAAEEASGKLSTEMASEGREKTFQDFHLSQFSALEFLKSSGIIAAFC